MYGFASRIHNRYLLTYLQARRIQIGEKFKPGWLMVLPKHAIAINVLTASTAYSVLWFLARKQLRQSCIACTLMSSAICIIIFSQLFVEHVVFTNLTLLWV
jgi:hypothetical protein